MKKFLLIALIGMLYFYWQREQQVYVTPKPKPPEPNKLVESEDFDSSMPKEDLLAVKKIRASFATGDFGNCLTLADTYSKEEFRSLAFKNWLKKQLETILNAYGWFRLKTGRCDDALDIFKRAQRIKPSIESEKGLAYCNYINHNLDAAEDSLTWLLNHGAENDREVLHIHAEVLESQGRYAEAVKSLEASNATQNDPLLEKKIKGMKEKAKKASQYQSISTRYFALTYEENAHREIAEKTLELLEDSLDDLLISFRFREPKRPIEVLLYTEEDYKNFTPESPLWAEALFNGRIRVPVRQPFQLERLRAALRHELVHALFSQMSGGRPIPPWFDEGIAQLASRCNRDSCQPFQFDRTPSSFLSEEAFHRPFVKYNEHLAHQVYSQSLYLVMTLKNRYKSNWQSVIEFIKVDSPLDSQSLLQQVHTSFPDLRKNAEALWQNHHTFQD